MSTSKALTERMLSRVPCGTVLGHGVYCSKGYECEVCSNILKLAKLLGIPTYTPPKEYKAKLVPINDVVKKATTLFLQGL